MSDEHESCSREKSTISRTRALILILLLFVLSRILFYLAGVRFLAEHLDDYWQFVDPVLLKANLLQSIYYLHSQPPLFNLFLGIILKLFPGGETAAFACIYFLSGLALHISMFLVMTRLGVSVTLSLILTGLFMISPSSILYENWLFYTYPVTLFLLLATLFWHRFLVKGAVGDGAVFFTLLTLVVLTRSVFHILWFLVFVGVLIFYRRRHWRKIVIAFCIPFAVMLFVYAKNLCLFGSFASSTWLGMSYAKITTGTLPLEVRELLVREGTLSELSLADPYADPTHPKLRAYFETSRATGIPVLDEEYKSAGHTNFNNIAYSEISNQFLADAIRVALAYPRRVYLWGVRRAFEIYLHPASHSELLRHNRAHIRTFESAYCFLLHGQWLGKGGPPTKSGGTTDYYTYDRGQKERFLSKAWFIVVGCPLLMAYGLFLIGKAIATNRMDSPFIQTVLFLTFNVVYVSVVANLLELGENNRFRFMVDPMLLILFGLFLERGLSSKVTKLFRQWGSVGLLRKSSLRSQGLSKPSLSP